MRKSNIIYSMAMAVERERARPYEWNEKQIFNWCFRDTGGRRAYARSLRLARVIYRTLEAQRLLKTDGPE